MKIFNSYGCQYYEIQYCSPDANKVISLLLTPTKNYHYELMEKTRSLGDDLA